MLSHFARAASRNARTGLCKTVGVSSLWRRHAPTACHGRVTRRSVSTSTRARRQAHHEQATEEAGETAQELSPERLEEVRTQARRMVKLLSVGVACLVASPAFFMVGRVVDRPLPDHIPPAIVGDWTSDDGGALLVALELRLESCARVCALLYCAQDCVCVRACGRVCVCGTCSHKRACHEVQHRHVSWLRGRRRAVGCHGTRASGVWRRRDDRRL